MCLVDVEGVKYSQGHEILFPFSLLPSLHTARDSSGCSTFTGLPAGRHGVRVFVDNNKFKSGFFYFTTS